MSKGFTSPYRHGDVALMRAAAVPLRAACGWWPDLADARSCQAWLREAWSLAGFVDAVQQASPSLARRVEAVCEGEALPDKPVRRATLALIRYLMRAVGRPTPFGLFAGVAPVSLAAVPAVRWGEQHRAVARVDTQWLSAVIDQFEAVPELLERLDVVFTDLAVLRGRRLEAPLGPNRVSVRATGAVQAVREAAMSPVPFAVLADKVAAAFGAEPAIVRDLLQNLVRQGLLVTCLRAPLTVVDALGHLVERLRAVQAETLAPAAALSRQVEALARDLAYHNHPGAPQACAREAVLERMGGLSKAGRTPLAVDLLLDCDLRLPAGIAHEMQQAAGVLLRLSRRPAGGLAWEQFHAAFCERYGTGTLVPLTEVLSPDTGIGLPAGYPGSLLPMPAEAPSQRDERLLALAWQAAATGNQEIELTDATVAELTDDDGFDPRYVPPHVEMAARIHAVDIKALQQGDYELIVSPARSAGTLTSRFTPTASGSELEQVYRTAPTVVDGALPVQLSVPPVYPHSQNVARIPAYLPHVLSLGEHRGSDQGTIRLNDLALIATTERLYLVSVSRRQVIEPQVFHALALDKQLPPLARFLAYLPRAFTARWHEFDWGAHAHHMPYLPRVRYRRTVLAPARWRLRVTDLPAGEPGPAWRQALDRWRLRWRCPDLVELRDDERTLRLRFTEPAHLAVLHAHLRQHGVAVLTDAVPDAAYGWLDGHVHEIAVPLARVTPGAPAPRLGTAPLLGRGHGHLPAANEATWLFAKLYTHPERMDDILTSHLPELFAALGVEPAYWFVRYRSAHDTDHLRLRLHLSNPVQARRYLATLSEWANRLRIDGAVARLAFDTYYPEVGRYGWGSAMAAAEAVFAADSRSVVAGLRHRTSQDLHPGAQVAVGMVDLVCGFFGDRTEGMRWLLGRPSRAAAYAEREAAEQTIAIVRRGGWSSVTGWPPEARAAEQECAAALATYRRLLPEGADLDAVVESLLHMHHNRVLGINPDGEATCRRLARQAAVAWQAWDGKP